jgi:hypothetical protein
LVLGARRANISGGVPASLPSQNGQGALLWGAGAGGLKSLGRLARSLAMITHRPNIGSFLNSGIF